MEVDTDNYMLCFPLHIQILLVYGGYVFFVVSVISNYWYGLFSKKSVDFLCSQAELNSKGVAHSQNLHVFMLFSDTYHVSDSLWFSVKQLSSRQKKLKQSKKGLKKHLTSAWDQKNLDTRYVRGQYLQLQLGSVTVKIYQVIRPYNVGCLYIKEMQS